MSRRDHKELLRRLGPDLLGPVGVYYIARIAGVDQTPALLLAAAVPVLRAVRSYRSEGRVSGLTLFMLAAVGMSAVMSVVTGDPRMLLIRSAWGTAALGLLLLATLLMRRPLLYSAATQIFDEQQRRDWASSWEHHPAFRRVLWACTAAWGVLLVLDATGRVVMALTLPVDVVPLLDDLLLVVVIAAMFVFQRVVGRRMLRRAGLRLDGTRVTPVSS
ncbi:hypothetical protein FB381_0350 [Nocardioides albertanoniae]|uniref:Intracellular septation protein A n=1 Tax=Nocardioides albertanoniae TaxID=1175486 RepID=A0A543A1N1_9ACTN|nr:VC0807 family protein [Nocardioides albertanoniae]TQL66488.1 hypothetical protein FB381_0350 [Nocardioides albertanoniae]